MSFRGQMKLQNELSIRLLLCLTVIAKFHSITEQACFSQARSNLQAMLLRQTMFSHDQSKFSSILSISQDWALFCKTTTGYHRAPGTKRDCSRDIEAYH